MKFIPRGRAKGVGGGGGGAQKKLKLKLISRRQKCNKKQQNGFCLAREIEIFVVCNLFLRNAHTGVNFRLLKVSREKIEKIVTHTFLSPPVPFSPYPNAQPLNRIWEGEGRKRGEKESSSLHAKKKARKVGFSVNQVAGILLPSDDQDGDPPNVLRCPYSIVFFI